MVTYQFKQILTCVVLRARIVALTKRGSFAKEEMEKAALTFGDVGV